MVRVNGDWVREKSRKNRSSGNRISFTMENTCSTARGKRGSEGVTASDYSEGGGGMGGRIRGDGGSVSSEG